MIKDERFFDVNFSSEILHRKNELKLLIALYSTLILRPCAISVNQFITGKVGVGKTITIKKFCDDFVKIAVKNKVLVKYVHINCRKERSGYKILLKIIRSFNKNMPKRGYSHQDFIEIITDHLDAQKMHFLLVLDDLDSLIKKGDELLYDLTRLNDDLFNKPAKVSIIGIVRDLSSILAIKDEIRDYFSDQHLEFKRYNKRQIFDILKHKTANGFHEGVITDEIIEWVAELVYPRGDIRYGINILWKSAILAQSRGLPSITLDCVASANQKIFPSSNLDFFELKTKDKLIFLLGIVRRLKKSNTPQTTVREVLDGYIKLCEKAGISPQSYLKILTYLREYQDEKILSIDIKNNDIASYDSIIKIPYKNLSELEVSVINLLDLKGI